MRFDPYSRTGQVHPYPVYRWMRDEAPVYHNEEIAFYALSRHEDVLAAHLDPGTFSSAHGTQLDGMDEGLELLFTKDPPEHTIHRRLVTALFTPRSIADLEPRIRALVVRLLDDLVDVDEFDLVRQLAGRVPLVVACDLLGVPPSLVDTVGSMGDRFLARDVETRELPPDAALARSELYDLFVDITQERRKSPGDDVISVLIRSELITDHGSPSHLTDHQIASRFTEMSVAGHETTTKLVASGAVALWWYPDQRRQLAEDPSLIPNAVEEMLRWDTPAQFAGRWTTRDVDLHGRTIPADSRVLLIRASANHDERVFEHPELFDIHRKILRHFGFGFGPHMCLGAALARLETRIMFEELLARFPEFEIDASRVERADALAIRGIKRLPVWPGARRASPRVG